jgi:D-aminoacyl-tRNA deacylase
MPNVEALLRPIVTFGGCGTHPQLYGKLTKKHQPDYKHAMKSIAAQEMYNEFLALLRSNYEHEKIKDGVFGAMMDVSLVNDGPVTIIIESSAKSPAATQHSSVDECEAAGSVAGEKGTDRNA